MFIKSEPSPLDTSYPAINSRFKLACVRSLAALRAIALKLLLNCQAMQARFKPPGGGVLPYMGYIGMCGTKGYGFSAVLVVNRVSILADFGHFGHK